MKAKLFALVFSLSLVLTGCFGGGGSGPNSESQVNAAIDRLIQAIMAQDADAIVDSLASKITVSVTNDSGSTISGTFNPEEYIEQFVGQDSSESEFYTYTYTQLKYQISGRKVTVSGSQASVSGYLLAEYRTEYDYKSELLDDATYTYRETAEVTYVLVKSGDSWKVSEFHVDNFKQIEI